MKQMGDLKQGISRGLNMIRSTFIMDKELKVTYKDAIMLINKLL